MRNLATLATNQDERRTAAVLTGILRNNLGTNAARHQQRQKGQCQEKEKIR